MTLTFPNLDDRRWTDLVDEAKTLIPLYAPEWTDHNLHDPGISFMELFAWVAEMDIYRLNRVPDERRRKFLSLIGATPRPPCAASTVIEFKLHKATTAGPNQRVVARGMEAMGITLTGERILFQTTQKLTVVSSSIAVVQRNIAGRFEDLSQELLFYREPVLPWGASPRPGAILYLGLTKPLLKRQWATFYFVATQDDHDEPALDVQCGTKFALHHSARLVWEFFDQSKVWCPLRPEMIRDETQALTKSGRILLRVNHGMAAVTLGESSEERYYLRCRLVTASYDAPPELRSILLNAVEAKQRCAVNQSFGSFNASDDALPQPGFQVSLPTPMVEMGKIRVKTEIHGRERNWQPRADFLASGKRDAHFVVDPYGAVLTFGDGNQGRTVPSGATIKVSYRATRGAEGNVVVKESSDWARTEHNTRLTNFDTLADCVDASFPFPASGGSSGETLAQAVIRAIRDVENPQRCVTLADFERLAMKTPGVRLARTKAIANLHPHFLCFQAPGVITLLVLPYLPADQPAPSSGLLQKVAAFLAPRRMLGTRLEVVGPQYVEVTVRARVRPQAKADPQRVAADAFTSINTFFHPLGGGPDGKGWPFGRDVYRSEVLQVLDESPGVDHVAALEFVDRTGKLTCGNVCLPLTALVAPGNHSIEIEPQV